MHRLYSSSYHSLTHSLHHSQHFPASLRWPSVCKRPSGDWLCVLYMCGANNLVLWPPRLLRRLCVFVFVFAFAGEAMWGNKTMSVCRVVDSLGAPVVLLSRERERSTAMALSFFFHAKRMKRGCHGVEVAVDYLIPRKFQGGHNNFCHWGGGLLDKVLRGGGAGTGLAAVTLSSTWMFVCVFFFSLSSPSYQMWPLLH